MVSGFVDQLLKAAEENRVARFAARCQRLKQFPKLFAEIELDPHFPKAAVALLKDSLPRLACKWLNKFGVSAEFRDELACVTAVLLIVKNDRATFARVDAVLLRLEKEAKPQATAPAVTMPATKVPEVGK